MESGLRDEDSRTSRWRALISLRGIGDVPTARACPSPCVAACLLIVLSGLSVSAPVASVVGSQADEPERPDDVEASTESDQSRERFDGTFKIPKSKVTVKLGGFVDVVMIHDFDAIGSEDTFDPTTIPTDGRDGENTTAHVKWSRINLDIGRPTRRGRARVFVEGDFFGSGSTFRLRHAFGSVGPILAGKTWSTFMDEDALPPTLDLDEPRATIMTRQAMVRWTPLENDRWLAALALEAPGAEIETPEPGTTEDPYPDITFRTRRFIGAGHVQLSGFVGVARFRADVGGKEDETIAGLNVSGVVPVGRLDRFRVQVAYGKGLGRYRDQTAVATDEAGNLEAIPAAAGVLSYQHFWSERLWSHAVYSKVDAESRAGQGADALEAIEYAGLNLVWEFAEGITIGAEWLYGTREDKNGASGEAHRLQIAFKYNFFE